MGFASGEPDTAQLAVSGKDKSMSESVKTRDGTVDDPVSTGPTHPTFDGRAPLRTNSFHIPAEPPIQRRNASETMSSYLTLIAFMMFTISPVLVPLVAAGRPRPPAALLLSLPHHDQWRAVHLVRPVLGLLRDGHRRAALRAARAERGARELRRLRHLRDSLPARRAAPGERARHGREPRGVGGQQPHRGPGHPSAVRSG